MRILDRVPDGVLRNIDNWRLWTVISFFALAAVTVWLAFVNSTQQAAARASYNDCVRSIPYLARISRHVAGVNDLAELLVQNSKATIAAAPPSDPLTSVRVANLRRLEKAQRKVASAKSVQVPTVDQCRERFLS